MREADVRPSTAPGPPVGIAAAMAGSVLSMHPGTSGSLGSLAFLEQARMRMRDRKVAHALCPVLAALLRSSGDRRLPLPRSLTF